MRHFNLQNAQLFDEFPNWKNIMFLPVEVRQQAFADPATREKLREDLATKRMTNFHRRWDIVQVEKVVKEENKRYEGKSVAEMAAMRNQDPVDALLDLSLDEGLLTTFQNAQHGRRRAGHGPRSCAALTSWWAPRTPAPTCSTAPTSATARRCWACGSASGAS